MAYEEAPLPDVDTIFLLIFLFHIVLYRLKGITVSIHLRQYVQHSLHFILLEYDNMTLFFK